MPMLRSTGLAWNDTPICGSAVAMTVPSRFSIKNAVATRIEIALDFSKRGDIILDGQCKFPCKSADTKACVLAEQPCLNTPYFALATSGRGIASTGKCMGYGWYG